MLLELFFLFINRLLWQIARASIHVIFKYIKWCSFLFHLLKIHFNLFFIYISFWWFKCHTPTIKQPYLNLSFLKFNNLQRSIKFIKSKHKNMKETQDLTSNNSIISQIVIHLNNHLQHKFQNLLVTIIWIHLIHDVD